MNSDDYKNLFFSTIGKAPGQPADDYEQVLGASGIPAGYAAYVRPDCATMPFHAMTQQIGSDGRIAGRIFLPASGPDENGYYTHPFSPLKDGPTPGSLLWEWRDLGIGTPVLDPCGGTGEGVPPTTTGISTEEVQAMIDAAMQNAIKLGDKIALRTNSGLLAGIQGGGPTSPDQPINWIGKEGDAHSWESLTIEKGE